MDQMMDAEHIEPGLAAFHRAAMAQLQDVARFARWLTKDPADADDLVQETYLRAFRGWRSFQAGTDCRAWLFTICRNAHVGHRRREGRIEATDAPELEALAAAEVYRDARSSGLDGVFGRFDLHDAVRRELEGIPGSYREVVVLVDIEDQTYDEAARILSVPVGTVRSRLFRGRRLLQERLLAYAHDAGFARTIPGKGE